MSSPATSYVIVYHLEIGLLFAALVAIGPLARYAPVSSKPATETSRFGLADLPA